VRDSIFLGFLEVDVRGIRGKSFGKFSGYHFEAPRNHIYPIESLITSLNVFKSEMLTMKGKKQVEKFSFFSSF
jgi:hypothetical protein